jgi:hypothetical protein
MKMCSTLALTLLLLLLCLGCSSSQIEQYQESWSTHIRIDDVVPGLITQGTSIVVIGDGFVGDEIGTSRLVMEVRDQVDTNGPYVTITELLTRDGRQQMTTVLSNVNFERICPFSSVNLSVKLSIETVSASSSQLYRSPTVEFNLQCQREITPVLERVPFGAVSLNDAIVVEASGVLIGEREGITTAIVSGCIKAQGVSGVCDGATPIITNEQLDVIVTDSTLRRNPAVIISPRLIGLDPGFFEGTIHLRNTLASGVVLESSSLPFTFQVLSSSLNSLNVNGTSLGGYLDFSGSGFIGLDPQALTTMLIEGQFENEDGTVQEIRTEIVTQFSSPNLIRYVLNEEDTLGQLLKLRKHEGVVVANFTPILSYGSRERQLPSLSSAFEVRSLRQVVHAHFLPGFDDALERFGLLEAAPHIKNIIVERSSDIFSGIGLEVRQDLPTDFALYSQVDLTGFDPNGIGLMGYDNTPGKDVGNERLHDRIGGVHALTQEDGYPGYGGIFLESFFGFSQVPPAGIESHPGASPLFDRIFDPIRSETGTPVSRSEANAFVLLPPSQICLAAALDRPTQVNCAIAVLGNLIGATMAHEIAHSLGLADPEGSLFHNPQPAPHHLMDSGGERPFEERAMLTNSVGEYFCQENYAYLRDILSTSLPDPIPSRTPCY